MVCINDYIGKVVTKFLVAFLADHKVLQFFIESGNKFHALIASFRKVFFAKIDLPSSIRVPFDTALVFYLSLLNVTFFSFAGY